MQHLSEGTLLQGGKYKIEKVLGQGGFGITYLATQVLLGRKVCVKEFFFKQFCERDEATSHVTLCTKSNREIVDRFMEKFLKEARTISQLNHNNIIRIHDIFNENSTAYYVMEYHSGGSLADLVRGEKPLPEADAVRYITQIADAVGYIHKRKINHLDIKPGNILLDDGGAGVLIDFGLSKQYDEHGDQTSSTPVGISHGYAPMEQYKQKGVSVFSPQSDIYALGATLYKLVTGATPPQAMDILDEGLPALPQSLSVGVRKAIVQAMQPRKIDRPATAEEFIALLGASGEADDDSEETMVNALHEETFIDVQPKVTVVSEPVKKTPEQPAEQSAEPKKAEKPKETPAAPAEKPKENPAAPAEKPEKPKENPAAPEPQKSNPWKWVAAAVVLLLLAVGGINWWGDYKAEQQRLAAIEQARQDSIAKVSAEQAEQQRLAAIEQARQDSIAKARAVAEAEQQRLAAIEQARQDSIAKVRAAEKTERQRLAAIERARKDSIAKVRAAEKEAAKKRKKYDYKGNYYEGLALVKLNDKWGYIDKSGNEVIPIKYDYVDGFSEGLARVNLNDKWGFIDKSGKEITPLKYDYASELSEGLAAVKLNGKWGFIDKNGNEVVPPKHDNTYDFREGLACVKLNGKWGFIDKSGNVVIPFKYDDAHPFSEGLASVELNGKCGFIDKSGNVVIPLKYIGAGDFNKGLAPVKQNGKWGFIGKSGNEVIPFKYDDASSFKEGLAAVKLNGKWGFIDKSGNFVIPLKYDYANSFFEGSVTVKLNGELFNIDKKGNRID